MQLTVRPIRYRRRRGRGIGAATASGSILTDLFTGYCMDPYHWFDIQSGTLVPQDCVNVDLNPGSGNANQGAINQEAQDVVKAGAGRITMDQAMAQATADQTALAQLQLRLGFPGVGASWLGIPIWAWFTGGAVAVLVLARDL